MLSIYNESKHAWDANEVSERVFRIQRSRTITRKSDPTGQPVTQVISIIGHAQIYGDVTEVNKKITSLTETKETTLVSDNFSSVIFNKKAFRPFIISQGKYAKDIVLGTIALNGRRIVDMSIQSAFLMEHMIFAGEFSFIASLNAPNAKFDFKIFDDQTKTIQCYHFYKNENGIICGEVTEEDAADHVGSTKIRKFRPSSPTYVILVQKEAIDILKKLVTPEYHNIIEIDKHNFDDVVKNLKNENYKAVTLFNNISSTDNSNIDKIQSSKKKTDSLVKSFQTVYGMFNDGRIRKIRF